MADSPVTDVAGVGKKISEVLARHSIRTAGQLAAAHPEEIQVKGIDRLIQSAQRFIGQPDGSSPKPSVQMVVSAQSGKKEEKQNEEEKEDHYVITNHSWYQETIRIPHPETQQMQNAVIWEMVLLPSWSVVGLLCSMLETEDEVLETPLTAPFIFHFNPNLPSLTIQMIPADYASLPNRTALEAILREVELMRNHPQTDD